MYTQLNDSVMDRMYAEVDEMRVVEERINDEMTILGNSVEEEKLSHMKELLKKYFDLANHVGNFVEKI